MEFYGQVGQPAKDSRGAGSSSDVNQWKTRDFVFQPHRLGCCGQSLELTCGPEGTLLVGISTSSPGSFYHQTACAFEITEGSSDIKTQL